MAVQRRSAASWRARRIEIRPALQKIVEP